MRGKLIINANEATNQPAIRDVNILKGLITETDLIINPKNIIVHRELLQQADDYQQL